MSAGLKIAIVGHNRGLPEPWDPDTIETGLPGSEESVVYASMELARLGHQVNIFMNPHPTSKWKYEISNPRWFHVSEWSSEGTYYDLILMWRLFVVPRGRGKIILHWPHDSPPHHGTPVDMRSFDGLLMLSHHHWHQYLNTPVLKGIQTIPTVICGNGIVLNHFPSPMKIKNPFSIGYFSNYARGLVHLLQLWPSIHRAFPVATLGICYGREHWGTCHPDDFAIIVSLIEKYKPMGVFEYGKVGHLHLAQIMQQTSIWAYPCATDTETFCITAIKAQLAGMIPVVIRRGALQETVHPDAPSAAPIKNQADLIAYGNLLLQTLHRIYKSDPHNIKYERAMYIEFARQFTWTACVNTWLNLYDKLSATQKLTSL